MPYIPDQRHTLFSQNPGLCHYAGKAGGQIAMIHPAVDDIGSGFPHDPRKGLDTAEAGHPTAHVQAIDANAACPDPFGDRAGFEQRDDRIPLFPFRCCLKQFCKHVLCPAHIEAGDDMENFHCHTTPCARTRFGRADNISGSKSRWAVFIADVLIAQSLLSIAATLATVPKVSSNLAIITSRLDYRYEPDSGRSARSG